MEDLSRTPAGPAGGELAGTYPDPTVASGAVNGFFGPTRNIASGTLGVYDFGSGAVIAGSVGSGAVVSGNVASGQLGHFHIAANAISSGQINVAGTPDGTKFFRDDYSWTAAGAGVTGTGVANQVTFWTGASTVAGNANFTYDAATSIMTLGASRFFTYGTGNFFMGASAGNQTMTGTDNIGIGSGANAAITGGTHNIAIGNLALDAGTGATGNVAIGHGALSTGTNSSYMTAVGYQALATTNSGSVDGLSAFGYHALTLNTNGQENSAFGYRALASNGGGETNSAFGYQAADSVTTGSRHCAFGDNALGTMISDFDGAAFGYYALRATTAGKNSAFGSRAGYSVESGTKGCYIGYYADTVGNITNCVALGNEAKVDADNTMVFGNAAVVLIRPMSNGLCDLGTSALPWKSIYAGTSIVIGTAGWTASATAATGLTAQANARFSHGTTALATTATEGFLHIQSCAGTPTGIPASIPTGQIPMVYDSTNNRLWLYNGSWRGVGVTV